jgi:type IV pilus assembly protein PilY1
LATLRDADGNPQPITARPEVGSHPDGNEMIYVGTGKFFEVGDEVVPVDQSLVDVQSFYGLYDSGSPITGDRDQALQAQQLLGEVTEQGHELRSSTDTEVDYSNYRGWYLDLVSPVVGREGERVVSTPLLRSGRLIFTTLIPSEDPCAFGGSGWLMELSAVTGSRLEYPPLDLNNDGEINEMDTISAANSPTGQPIAPSGKKSQVGIIKTPGIVSAGEVEYKYTSGSSGQIEVLTEQGDDSRGRQSWIQLR